MFKQSAASSRMSLLTASTEGHKSGRAFNGALDPVGRLLWLVAVVSASALVGVAQTTPSSQPSTPTLPQLNTSSPVVPAPKPATTQSHRARRGPLLDEEVKKLTLELTLDENQQAMVRIILQHRQGEIIKVFADGSLSAVDRFAAVQKLHEISDNQINRILNKDQATKFEILRHGAPHNIESKAE